MKYILFAMFLMGVVSASDDEYIDPIIDMLLNGRMDMESSDADDIELNGIWKCGNCSDIGEEAISFSEVFDNLNDDDSTVTTFEFTVEDMKCIVVSSEKPGVVVNVSGSCNGSTVTLNILPNRYFVIKGYN